MTADQDIPNSVGQEAAFWAAQRELPHGAERPEEPASRRIPWAIIITAIAGIGACLFLWGYANRARAAQPADHMRPHEITLLIPPGTSAVGIITISAAYPDRAACEKAKMRVTVKAPGGKLVCGIASPFRVR